MSSLIIEHKRGDTFVFNGQAQESGVGADLTGFVARAQVRDLSGLALIADLEVTIDPDQTTDDGRGWMIVACGDTSAWPLARLKFDVELTGPIKVSSPTYYINVSEDVTHD